MVRDEQARALWHDVYGHLSSGHPGLLGEVTSRATAHVVRLSMIYALLDGSAIIRLPHLEAALALWDFCAKSAAYLFGESTGDADADTILAQLRERPRDGLSRTAIRDLFGRNRPRARIDEALGLLEESGLAFSQVSKTNGRGRPTEIWFPGPTTHTSTTEPTEITAPEIEEDAL
jgi:hypothetical protein